MGVLAFFLAFSWLSHGVMPVVPAAVHELTHDGAPTLVGSSLTEAKLLFLAYRYFLVSYETGRLKSALHFPLEARRLAKSGCPGLPEESSPGEKVPTSSSNSFFW